MEKSRVLNKNCMMTLLVVLFLSGTALATFGQALGDVDGNGSISITDAMKIAQYYVGLNPSGFNINVADVDGNGTVAITDAMYVAQFYVGLITQFPGTGTPVSGTPVPVVTAAPTAVSGTPAPVGSHLDNPFVGATWFVNPDWSAKAAAGGGSRVANYNTAVWMDRVAAVTGGSGSCTFTGLRATMDSCVSQGANLIIIVVYDMPNRDCSSEASAGEFRISEDGVNRYKTEYIDPIVSTLSDSKYNGIRIVCIIEPDSLANLVTNTSKPDCAEANSTGAYAACTQYAINQLKAIGNHIYMYVDIAHDAWLGWDSNFGSGMDIIGNIIKNTTAGVNSIDGFISNVANTLPFEEPFITDSNRSVGGQPIKNSRFFDFNPYHDERDFCVAWRSGMISRGFPSTIGMLVDTSRNGWGGSRRPTAVSTSTDLNTYVDQSRIDRRYHRGNWCNQVAGIGARPQAAPYSGFDAFVWIKPPGESDGISVDGVVDPCDPNKSRDPMCIPGGTNIYCSCGTNDSMSGGPHAGGWFQALFDALVQNAYPAL